MQAQTGRRIEAFMPERKTPVLAELVKGIIRNNPIFVMLLGLCPTLAITTSVENGFWMAVATTGVLVASNIIIASLRRIVPEGVRIPCFIVVIASFVTMAELLMSAFLPVELNKRLSIYIPLIVVNCIIFGRAEAFARKSTVVRSFLDGVGAGIGFGLAMLLISSLRELSGSGTLGGYVVIPGYNPASIMVQAPGAFILIGLLLATFNWMGARKRASRRKGRAPS